MINTKKNFVAKLNEEICRQTFEVPVEQYDWNKVSTFVKILDIIDPLVKPSQPSNKKFKN